MNTIKTNIKEKHWPDIINVVKELPRTSVGKVDYKVLNTMGEELFAQNKSIEKLYLITE